MEIENGIATLDNSLTVSKIYVTMLPYESVIPLVDAFEKIKKKMLPHKNAHTNVHYISI